LIDEGRFSKTINKIGYPIVLKPLDGNHGKGASINVTNWEDAVSGLAFKNTVNALSLKNSLPVLILESW
jgi:biotin carboxylase